MFFNSLSFAIFLPIVFLFYWFIFAKNKTTQNAVLIVASYYFYSCWDWRFLFLLVFSTLLDYFSAIMMENSTTDKKRKLWLWLTIGINLGFLGVFKYYDFFAQSFADLLQGFGFHTNPVLLKLILPVGISFYTFHGLSYVIDIYYKRITAERNFIDYSLFVSYFPLLVAGPIERATHLLPQVKVKRHFDLEKAKEGVYQIIWGLVKKVVIADSCATYANAVFDHYESMNSLSLALGAVYFAFQLYGDFSGYSDISLGTYKLFGIDLLKNFNYPYFSRDIAEFWRRWHISLSSWLRDYLYIPLGGSQLGKVRQNINLFLTMLIGGLWHGANFTFVVWGGLHGIALAVDKLRMKYFENSLTFIPSRIRRWMGAFVTFQFVCFCWIFFKSATFSDAFDMIHQIVSNQSAALWKQSLKAYAPVVAMMAFGFSTHVLPDKLADKWIEKYSRIPLWIYVVIFTILILLLIQFKTATPVRSEERRVGKECRSRWS